VICGPPTPGPRSMDRAYWILCQVKNYTQHVVLHKCHTISSRCCINTIPYVACDLWAHPPPPPPEEADANPFRVRIRFYIRSVIVGVGTPFRGPNPSGIRFFSHPPVPPKPVHRDPICIHIA
jgi:hypothetical protein